MHGTRTPRYLSRRPDARKPQHRSGRPKKKRPGGGAPQAALGRGAPRGDVRGAKQNPRPADRAVRLPRRQQRARRHRAHLRAFRRRHPVDDRALDRMIDGRADPRHADREQRAQRERLNPPDQPPPSTMLVPVFHRIAPFRSRRRARRRASIRPVAYCVQPEPPGLTWLKWNGSRRARRRGEKTDRAPSGRIDARAWPNRGPCPRNPCANSCGIHPAFMRNSCRFDAGIRPRHPAGFARKKTARMPRASPRASRPMPGAGGRAHRASRIARHASRVTPAPRRRGAHASDRRETPARSDRAGRRAA